MNIPRLETERLLLREYRESDFDAYAAILADPEVMRTLTGSPQPRWEAWRSFAMHVGHWVLRGYGMWSVEEKATGRFVGRVGLYYPEGWPGREVGWTIARECWGRGYAPEAGRAALRYAFDVLGWDRIISVIRPDNSNSIAVARKLGMTHQGEARVMTFDVHVYGRERGEV
jgi:RimJ/RimL family protein N-acetyltransferase